MKPSDQIVQHLIDIKERVARMEEKLDNHAEGSAKRDSRVDILEKKVLKAEASVKTLRFVAGLLLAGLPASVAALAKIWK